jgi:hypothetical protein
MSETTTEGKDNCVCKRNLFRVTAEFGVSYSGGKGQRGRTERYPVQLEGLGKDIYCPLCRRLLQHGKKPQ